MLLLKGKLIHLIIPPTRCGGKHDVRCWAISVSIQKHNKDLAIYR